MKPGSGGRALAGLAHRAGDAQFGASDRTDARERERDLALVRSRSPSTSRSVLAVIGRDISGVCCSSIVSTQDRRSVLIPSFRCMQLALKGLLTDFWSTNYFENHQLIYGGRNPASCETAGTVRMRGWKVLKTTCLLFVWACVCAFIHFNLCMHTCMSPHRQDRLFMHAHEKGLQRPMQPVLVKYVFELVGMPPKASLVCALRSIEKRVYVCVSMLACVCVCRVCVCVVRDTVCVSCDVCLCVTVCLSRLLLYWLSCPWLGSPTLQTPSAARL